MSTAQQVQDSLFHYVFAYLASNAVVVTSDFKNGVSDIFEISQDEKKVTSFSKWNTTVAQPTLAQLKMIVPSTISALKQYQDIDETFVRNPRLLTIFRNIFNRLSVSIPTNTYPTDESMKNYFRGMM